MAKKEIRESYSVCGCVPCENGLYEKDVSLFFFFINKCFVVTLALISVFERRANDSAALRASCCVTHGSTRVFYL